MQGGIERGCHPPMEPGRDLCAVALGTAGLPLLGDALPVMELCSLLLPPHIPTHPKTHPYPNPDGPSSSLHCHLVPRQMLYWGEKPGTLLTGDESALISAEELLAALPSSHCSVVDLGDTGDVKYSTGAGLHPRFPCSFSKPHCREGKRHTSNIWAGSAGIARAEEFLLSSTL